MAHSVSKRLDGSEAKTKTKTKTKLRRSEAEAEAEAEAKKVAARYCGRRLSFRSAEGALNLANPALAFLALGLRFERFCAAANLFYFYDDKRSVFGGKCALKRRAFWHVVQQGTHFALGCLLDWFEIEEAQR